MNEDTISRAIVQAHEFIRRAECLLTDMRQEGRAYLVCGSAQSGSVRRQSLELTRALADMRKPL